MVPHPNRSAWSKLTNPRHLRAWGHLVYSTTETSGRATEDLVTTSRFLAGPGSMAYVAGTVCGHRSVSRWLRNSEPGLQPWRTSWTHLKSADSDQDSRRFSDNDGLRLFFAKAAKTESANNLWELRRISTVHCTITLLKMGCLTCKDRLQSS